MPITDVFILVTLGCLASGILGAMIGFIVGLNSEHHEEPTDADC